MSLLQFLCDTLYYITNLFGKFRDQSPSTSADTTGALPPRALAIKRKLGLLRRLFLTLVDGEYRQVIDDYSQISPPERLLPADLTIWKLHPASPFRYLRAGDDELAPPHIRSAYKLLNLCDASLWVTIKAATKAFKDTGVAVAWYLVQPQPQLIFVDEDQEPVITTHSVFVVSDTMDGARYVADFTIEQFGHDAGAWFGTWAEYTERFTAGAETWQRHLRSERKEINEQMKMEEYWAQGRKTLRVVLAGLDWADFERMSDERRQFVEEEMVVRVEEMIGKYHKQPGN
ncbi:hypothetical protein BU26DRAFT_570502 [Trematosphaeria pertusa]|uniref:Uncharacterized protein n=1 Tax=Trematosphaeria pertusa TaxID=390896 RepID=A0A6A6HYX4_9PLEO|nr:uncharacterized protein BU26DRAFT_570502 [Trematosphaeria pertusa]KAF2243099.1 hypothetical protein BU26DRAFT_570502 [Trematosphaeria pertusa]